MKSPTGAVPHICPPLADVGIAQARDPIHQPSPPVKPSRSHEKTGSATAGSYHLYAIFHPAINSSESFNSHLKYVQEVPAL
jgi:hypothetical protein